MNEVNFMEIRTPYLCKMYALWRVILYAVVQLKIDELIIQTK